MDIGTATYTEFSESPDIISYMIDKDLLDTRVGLVHSHNNMETFFSGTDTATLKQEGLNHNHFVSLIVNNRGTYSAAITTVTTSKFKEIVQENYKYTTFDGVIIEGNDSYEEEYEETVILWSKLKVITPSNSYDDLEIKERIEYINKEKEKIRIANAKKVVNSVNSPVYTPNQNSQRLPVLQNKEIEFKEWSKKQITLEDDDPLMGKNFKNDNNSLLIPFPKGTEPEFEESDLENQDIVINYGDIHLSDEIVLLLSKKLVTGSILVPSNNKIELEKFIPNMSNLYKNVFPSLESYDFFIGNFIEAVIFDVEDPNLVGFSEEAVAAIAANSIIEVLSEYPTNSYLDVIISNLSNFVI